MDLEEIRLLFDKEQRREIVYPDSRSDVLPNLVRLIGMQGSGYIVYSCLDESNVEAAISDQITFFQATGHNFEWTVYDYDRPADLKERLVEHGFEKDEDEAVLVLDTTSPPPALLEPVSLDVRRITGPAGIEDMRQVLEQVWGRNFDDLAENQSNYLVRHPDFLSIYIAYASTPNGPLPVSTAWTNFHTGSHFASLWGGSTLPSYRGRGYYTALLATRMQEARARGVRFLTVDAGPMSRPILESLGFLRLATTYPCRWKVKKVSTGQPEA